MPIHLNIEQSDLCGDGSNVGLQMIRSAQPNLANEKSLALNSRTGAEDTKIQSRLKRFMFSKFANWTLVGMKVTGAAYFGGGDAMITNLLCDLAAARIGNLLERRRVAPGAGF